MMSVGKWPQIGDTLPVTVDRSNPGHFVLHLENIATGHQQAAQRAQAVAAQMRGGQTDATPGGSSTTTYTTEVGRLKFGSADWDPSPRSTSGDRGSRLRMELRRPPMSSARPTSWPRGTAGSATLLGTFPSDQVAEKPGRTIIGLMLNVMIDGRPPCQVTALYAAPMDKLVKLTPGALLPIKADPNQADIVAVDWDAV
jgi:hypothetical protein